MIVMPSIAQETTTYTYDALGRLIASSISGGFNNGTQTGTTFDPASNRTNYSVTGSPIPPSFAIGSATAVSEGNPLTFTVTKTGTTASSYSVNYTTATGSGTATPGTDYTATFGTLTFPAGSSTSLPITVPTLPDSVVESPETVLVTLSSPTGGATITTSQGSGTINDVPPPPSFAISNATAVSEGNPLTFTVTKTGTTTSSYSVNYATTTGGTATSGTDYTAMSGTLTFPAGATTSLPITVPTLPDSVIESPETVLVTLSSPTGGATITTSQGSGTINDVPPPSFAISNATAVSEGNPLTFTVTKTGTTTSSYSVNYATTTGGTATSGTDYTAMSGTLTFPAGATTSLPITVPTLPDSVIESPETVLVTLSAPTGGATITTSQGSGTINDVPPPPSFAIGNATAVSEGSPLTFTVTKTGTTSSTYSVNYATTGGTATSGTDYTATSGTLIFGAGSTTSQPITVPTLTDSVVESPETVLVTLSGQTGGATITASQGSGTINDNTSSNLPPVANADATSFDCSAYQTVNLVANDTDPENNVPLHLVSITGPGSATVTSTTSVTIGEHTTGTFTFSYVVADSLGATSTGQLTATVTGLASQCVVY
jgi:hypothetical protein